jgi:lanthanide-dependent methanol dehydrogenase
MCSRFPELLLIALLVSCTQRENAPDLLELQNDDAQWVMPAKNYASTRYSGLDQINANNVRRLKVAWTLSTGHDRGHEAAPLVIGDTMYFVTPFPNDLIAIDLKNPAGPVKWIYRPKALKTEAQGVACCDVVNRGAAYADGKIFFNALDGRTCAVDAKTGEEIWIKQVANIHHGETLTMAPLVVKDKVLVGNSGGEMGVRGWLTALDANSGQIAWRAWSTGPDEDVLIGPNFKPFYVADRGTNLGVTTWPKDRWKIGGGTVWGWISYDPELDLLYYGTANPGPWNPEMRPGDNKWTAGIFARRPDNGEAIWFYQWSPHDMYDHDGINEQLLLELPVAGQSRKVLLRPERNGYMYVLDRATGQVLSADPFAHITTSKGVDLKTGRLIPVLEKEPKTGKLVKDICPAAPGAKDWQPTAYSPKSRLLYVPHQNLCQEEIGSEVNYIEGTPYLGATVRMYAGPGGHRGEFCAWDPVARRKVWTIRENFPVWSGTLATAGDVVFYGTLDGWFKAVHARSGQLLWQIKLSSGIIGQPITYRGPDGKQYVTIAAGVGGWAGAVVAGGLDPRDPTGALGFLGATADLPQYTNKGGVLYTFALP